MAAGMIFPTSVYGQLSDVYGTNVTQYSANANGLPLNVGLQLGMFGVLFDHTICRLMKAAGTIAQYNAVTFSPGNSNDYTVVATSATGQAVVGTNDRSGSTSLVGGSTYNVAWFTAYGNGTTLVAASVTGGTNLQTYGTTGQLQAWFNANPANNLGLKNTTTTPGA